MMSATIIRPVQQILVATDFSDSADAALGVAIQYARGFRARMHLVHVFAAGEVDVTQLLADAAAQAGPDIPVSVAGTGGDPAEEILRYASRRPIDPHRGRHARTHRGESHPPGQRGRAGRARRPLSRSRRTGAATERGPGAGGASRRGGR
jgi:hypothetical protein